MHENLLKQEELKVFMGFNSNSDQYGNTRKHASAYNYIIVCHNPFVWGLCAY